MPVQEDFGLKDKHLLKVHRRLNFLRLKDKVQVLVKNQNFQTEAILFHGKDLNMDHKWLKETVRILNMKVPESK